MPKRRVDTRLAEPAAHAASRDHRSPPVLGTLGTASLLVLLLGLLAVPESSAQSPHIRPDLDPPGSEPVEEGELLSLTPSEERRLLRQILWQPEPEWGAGANTEAVEKLIGRSRQRRLEEARFQLHLTYDDWQLRNLADNPYAYERMKDSVLSAYVKLQRELLEEAFQIEERFDRWVDDITGQDEREDALRSTRGRSFDVRISPRVSVGSNEYFGLKFRMPHTKNRFFDSFSFRARHYFDRDQARFMLKYDDDDRFFHLEFEPDTLEEGDKWNLSVRLWF